MCSLGKKLRVTEEVVFPRYPQFHSLAEYLVQLL